MKSVIEFLDDLQARALANEVLFQSIISALPESAKADVIKNIEDNFSAMDKGTLDENATRKLISAKQYAARVSGAKI